MASIAFNYNNSGFRARDINGSVNTTFHLPPERQETPPCPSVVIPFPRDPDFVERGTIFDHIHKKCAVPGSRTALVGLGGVGKSQLAIEFAYQTSTKWPETWVFWVYASNAARFEQSYRDIADCAKIPGRHDPNANIFKLVYDWLRGSKERWLLILDNVDDARFLLDSQGNSQGEPTSKPLREYLPHCNRGSILVTTRNKEAALKLVEQRDHFTVEPMDKAQAVALLKKKLDMHVEMDEIAELAATLEYMPLAIVQAAAYIIQRAPRCSVRWYLEEFKRSEHKKISLLNCDEGQLRRDWEAKNSIIVTWQLSFEHIQQTRSSAAELLSLMSFFDRQGIPEALLWDRGKKEENWRGQKKQNDNDWDSDKEDDVSQSGAEESEFEHDIIVLRNFCFISVNSNGTTFEMHALVQLATRKWLEAKGKLERWKQQFINNLYAQFPTGEHENWAACQALFAHVKAAVEQQPKEEDTLVEWATVLYRAAWYAWRKGSISDAEKLAVKSMNTRKKVLGQEHEDTMWSLGMAGLVYDLGGRWSEAEELEVRVMETRKRVLGEEHPNTLTSIANLASTYRNQGRWKEAEELEVRVMETSLRVLGEEHPNTLTSVASLASTYRNQGRWKEAEELEVRVMETRKRVLGEEHPNTLTSIASLASTYWNQGRWKEAEELDVRVMETRKRVLSEEHPDTLTSVANLASTYWNQGRWKEAEELEVRVIETRKRVLSEEHPDTLTSVANLASTYRNQGRWKEAEELEVRVIETRKRVLGEEHPNTLASVANLASTYRNQGRWKEAEELEVRVMETRKRVLGEEHPNTLTSIANLASTYRNQGRLEEAESMRRQTLATREKVLGLEHPDTLLSVYNLAHILASRHRYDESNALYIRACARFNATLGKDHPDTRACHKDYLQMLSDREEN